MGFNENKFINCYITINIIIYIIYIYICVCVCYREFMYSINSKYSLIYPSIIYLLLHTYYGVFIFKQGYVVKLCVVTQ